MYSTAYHPETDGQSENFRKIILSMPKAFVFEFDLNKYHSDWEDCISTVLYSYHNTVHSATGDKPHHTLLGWTHKTCVRRLLLKS